MSSRLTDDAVAAALRDLPGWTRRGDTLYATFTFRDFATAFAFMTRVAAVAEQQQHHPDWRNLWSKVEISLSTHDAGGLTERDLKLARSIAELARSQVH
ncbi:MAG TPA: 4a-hydroxytetrahydrobiopterin dehydratase [Planctomycetota bacterium]|nr:4a-hydroxytetrahydrobiopterin dehydratase [Planctomycetota bacterium]